MENKAFGLFCVMVRVQNVLCSFFVCQILYEKRRCFGISSNVHQINEEIRAARPIKLEDRVKYMTEKNPLLAELRRALDLEVE
jgi:hypothetical protein